MTWIIWSLLINSKLSPVDLRHQTKHSIFGRSELSQFIVCIRLGADRLGKLGFNRLKLIRLRSSWQLAIYLQCFRPVGDILSFTRKERMQRNWPPDHFLIQTLIAFLNAPVHTARPCAEWTYSKRPVCCCWKSFIVWESFTVGKL